MEENSSNQLTDSSKNRRLKEPVENGVEEGSPDFEDIHKNHFKSTVQKNSSDSKKNALNMLNGDDRHEVENAEVIVDLTDTPSKCENTSQGECSKSKKENERNNSVGKGKGAENGSDEPIVIEDEVEPRRSQRPPKGPTVESLVEAAISSAASAISSAASASKVDTNRKQKVKVPKKKSVGFTKGALLRIDERKAPKEMENMRAMAQVLYGVGLDLAKQMVYKDIVRVQGKREGNGYLAQKEKEQLNKLRKRHEELCVNNKIFCSEAKMQCTMEDCDVKSDSLHALEYHKEEPHRTDGDKLLCSFCDFSTMTPVLFYTHMDVQHNRKAHYYAKVARHPCNMCRHDALTPKGVMKHKERCEKRFNLKRNLDPLYEICDVPIKKMFLPKLSTAGPSKPPVNSNAEKQLLQQQEKLILAGRTGVILAQPQQSVVVQQNVPTNNSPGISSNVAQPKSYSVGGKMYTMVKINGQYVLRAIQQAQPCSSVINVVRMQQYAPAPQSVITVSSSRQPAPQPKSTPKTSSSGNEICEICGGYVEDKESLRIHFYWAHKIDIRKDVFAKKDPSLSCEQCTEHFWTFQGYERHRKMTHDQVEKQEPKPVTPDVQCPLCRSPAGHILNHLLSVHKVSVTVAFEKQYCTICYISFPTVEEVEEHLIYLHGFSFLQNMPRLGQKSKPGTAPNEVSGAPVPLGELPKNKKKNIKCNVCRKTFRTLEDYTNHNHAFRCYRCGCRWNSYRMLVNHLSEAHITSLDECVICKAQFTVGKSFIEHMLTFHIKGLSVRVQRLSDATISRHMKRYRKKGKTTPVSISAPRISPLKSRSNYKIEPINIEPSPVKKQKETVPIPKDPSVEVINIDASPVKKQEETTANRSPVRHPTVERRSMRPSVKKSKEASTIPSPMKKPTAELCNNGLTVKKEKKTTPILSPMKEARVELVNISPVKKPKEIPAMLSPVKQPRVELINIDPSPVKNSKESTPIVSPVKQPGVELVNISPSVKKSKEMAAMLSPVKQPRVELINIDPSPVKSSKKSTPIQSPVKQPKVEVIDIDPSPVKKPNDFHAILSSVKWPRVELVNIDPSPGKKPKQTAAVQTSTKQPIILKIDDDVNNTIEIHENTVDDGAEK